MQYGAKDDIMEISDTPDGFRVSRKLQKDVAFDWTSTAKRRALDETRHSVPVRNGRGRTVRILASRRRSTNAPRRFSLAHA